MVARSGRRSPGHEFDKRELPAPASRHRTSSSWRALTLSSGNSAPHGFDNGRTLGDRRGEVGEAEVNDSSPDPYGEEIDEPRVRVIDRIRDGLLVADGLVATPSSSVAAEMSASPAVSISDVDFARLFLKQLAAMSLRKLATNLAAAVASRKAYTVPPADVAPLVER